MLIRKRMQSQYPSDLVANPDVIRKYKPRIILNDKLS